MTHPQTVQPGQQYWLQRAAEAHLLARIASYPDVREIMLKLASAFEEIAKQMRVSHRRGDGVRVADYRQNA